MCRRGLSFALILRRGSTTADVVAHWKPLTGAVRAALARAPRAPPVRAPVAQRVKPASRIRRSEAVSTSSSSRARKLVLSSPGAISGRNSTTATPGLR